MPGFENLVAGGSVLGATALLAVGDGGVSEANWYPVALYLLALLVVLGTVARPAGEDRAPAVERALLAYAAFVVWCYASIAWADAPGLAWDGANRVLLYGIVLRALTLRPWPPRATLWALCAVVIAITLLAVGTLVWGQATDAPRLFLSGRLSLPLGYANATANLWLIGAFPALALTVSRALGWRARGAALGAAVVLIELALVSQSRGSVIAFVVTSGVLIALSPRRWAVSAGVACAVAATALASSRLLSASDAREPSQLGPALDEASLAIVLSGVVVSVVGALAARRDERNETRATTARSFGAPLVSGRRVAALVAAAALVAGVATNPLAWGADRWQDFKTGTYAEVELDGSRLDGALGSNRYDFYRVALNELSDRPLTGVGVDSFGVGYLRTRRSDEHPRYAHGLGFSVLAETGVIGAGIFTGFLALTFIALLSAWRSAGPGRRGLLAAAACGAAVFFAHASVDWLWQFPALGLLAFGLLAVALRSGQEAGTAASPPRRFRLPSALRLGLAIAASVALAVPAARAWLVDAASSRTADDPRTALRWFELAADVDRVDERPLLSAGIIARRLGDADRARDAFEAAARRAPEGWFAPFELGLLDAAGNRRSAALAALDRARALNPHQPVITTVRAAVARGDRVDPDRVESELTAQLSRKLSATR